MKYSLSIPRRVAARFTYFEMGCSSSLSELSNISFCYTFPTGPWYYNRIRPARLNGFRCRFPAVVFPNWANALENLLLLYRIDTMIWYIVSTQSKSYPTSIDEGTTIVIISGILPESRYGDWYGIHICADRFWWSRSESLTRCDAMYRVKCTATRYLFTTSRLEFLKNYCSINSQNLLWCCSNIIQLYCNLKTRVCKCDDYTFYLLISLTTATKAHNDWYPKV